MNLNEDIAQSFARDYRHGLKQLFDQKKDANPSYSITAFARDLGISKTALFNALGGSRHLSLKNAATIIDKLGFAQDVEKKVLAQIPRSRVSAQRDEEYQILDIALKAADALAWELDTALLKIVDPSLDEFQQLLSQAETIYSELRAQTGQNDALDLSTANWEVRRAYYELIAGRCAASLSLVDAAISKLLNLRQRQPNNPKILIGLRDAYTQRSFIYDQTSEVEKNLESAKKALMYSEEAQRLGAEITDEDIRWDYIFVGYASYWVAKFRDGAKYFDHSIESARTKLANDKDLFCEELPHALRGKAMCIQRLGDLQQAYRLIREAAEIQLEAINRNPNGYLPRNAYSSIKIHLALYALQNRELKAARSAIDESVKYLRTATERDGKDVASLVALAEALRVKGAIHSAAGEWEGARRNFLESKKCFELTVKASPLDLKSRDQLHGTLVNYAAMLVSCGEVSDALAMLIELEKEHLKLMEQAPLFLTILRLLELRRVKHDALVELGRLEEAEEIKTSSKAEWRSFASQFPELSHLNWETVNSYVPAAGKEANS